MTIEEIQQFLQQTTEQLINCWENAPTGNLDGQRVGEILRVAANTLKEGEQAQVLSELRDAVENPEQLAEKIATLDENLPPDAGVLIAPAEEKTEAEKAQAGNEEAKGAILEP